MADFTLVPLLRKCSDDDLEPLVKFIKKAELTETLSESYGYCTHYPKHSKYADQIAHEIRLFGGNTIANKYRGCPPTILSILPTLAPIFPFLPGEGPPYKEVVQDVATKLAVDYEYYDSVERVEMKILLKILKDAFDKMSSKEKDEVIKAFEQEGTGNLDFRAGFPMSAILAQVAVKSSGFLAYQVAVIVANSVAKAVLGHGLKLATNAALTRAIGIFAGPIGWVITALWTAIEIAGPAYRVTIPCVYHVAYLRQKLQAREDFGGNE